jgi:glucosamine--fructose-6-phosphate aminotransferase (isomerizing)
VTEIATGGFLAEVAEQPAALRELVRWYRGVGLNRLEEWAARARTAGQVTFSGMGTSELVAGLVLAELGRNGVGAAASDAGELLHYPRPVPGVLTLISQSGESVETIALAQSMRHLVQLAAITNFEESTLARAAAVVLPIWAGGEAAISNKTYVNTLAVLHLLARAVRGSSAVLPALAALERLADTMPDVDRSGIARAADLLADASAIHFIGRGPGFVAARQAALTFMEGTRASAVALTGGGLRHGPFELVDASYRCVLFIPGGATAGLLAAMAAEIAEKGSHVVAVTDQDLRLPAETCQVLRVPVVGEDLFPLAASTTQEILLHEVALRRGVRAGEFRHSGKVTTRE